MGAGRPAVGADRAGGSVGVHRDGGDDEAAGFRPLLDLDAAALQTGAERRSVVREVPGSNAQAEDRGREGSGRV